MYTLFDSTIFYTIHSIVVCVDFLGTHIVILVLLFKTGCDRCANQTFPQNYLGLPLSDSKLSVAAFSSYVRVQD